MRVTVNKTDGDTATASASGGLGFTSLLTIVFITLKLTHYIDWSWWWVLCPLWIGLAIGMSFLLLMLIIFMIAIILKTR